MSEQVEQSQEDNAPIQQAEISTVEDQAREQGWVPKEDFQGDEAKWVEPAEFIRRGELFKKIDQSTRIAKRAEQTLAEFKKHYARVQEIATKQAIEALKAERKAAMVDGDFDRVEKLEDQIEVVKVEAATAQKEIQSTVEVPEVYPEVQEWVERNSWYNKDLPMKAYADTVAAQLNKQGISGSALLKGIDAEIRKAFPSKFSNPNRERVGAVEGSTNRGARGRGDSLDWMTEQDNKVMLNLTSGKDPVMTKEEYISDLKKIKGIK